jgi:TPR repeat protein
MARLTSYSEPIVGVIDLNEKDSQFRSRRSGESIAAKGEFLPEDTVPLFLSGHAGEPQQRVFGEAAAASVIASRILKISIFTALGAAIVLAILSVRNPLALFADAKVSLIGVSLSQAGTGQSAAAVRSTPGAQALPPNATGTPTRDEIAAALRSAHQSQPEIRQAAAGAPPPRLIDADELAALLKRARGLIAIGDIVAARLLLERAADAQEAGAALLLAQTYDPAVLGTPDARSITPDPEMARGWYQKAARFGSTQARQRLTQMEN